MTNPIKRGEVWLANLNPTQGSEPERQIHNWGRLVQKPTFRLFSDYEAIIPSNVIMLMVIGLRPSRYEYF
jgi:hypothetical protein